MQDVLQKAQELADAIRESEAFKLSREAERAAYADAEATRCVYTYYEKETAVRNVISGGNVDPEALAKAAQELEDARTAMQNNELVTRMQQANAACNDLINAISGILQQAIGAAQETGGCSGSCAGCSGGCAGRK